VLGLLRQLHPRVIVSFGCAILALAGMAGGVAWLNTLPPREQLLRLTGELQELRLEDAATGAFKITVVAEGKLYTFDFDHAQRPAALPSWVGPRYGRGNIAVDLKYIEIGRHKKVIDVVLGNERVLSYDEVIKRITEKVVKDRQSAIGFGAVGALLIFVGGLARLAQGSSHAFAMPNPEITIGAALWALLYGTALVVMLTEPAILHRAFGAEVFHLPIEYVLPAALARLYRACVAHAKVIAQRQRRQAGHGVGDDVGAGIRSSCRAANGHQSTLAPCLFNIAFRRLDLLRGHARHLTAGDSRPDANVDPREL
jgi:hypothetical protein